MQRVVRAYQILVQIRGGEQAGWQEGQPANLLVFDTDPQLAPPSTSSLYAVIDEGVIEILKPGDAN